MARELSRRMLPALLGLALGFAAAAAQATPIGGVVMTEVLFAPAGNDDSREWVEIYNGSNQTIDMADYSLGWGLDDVTTNAHVFDSFLLAPGSTFVIGGPTSLPNNGSPVYDEEFDFAPNLDDGTDGASAGAVALFAGDAGSGGTLLHLLVYGQSSASTSLLDEQGQAALILLNTDGFGQGSSAEWQGGSSWLAQAAEGPNTPALPEPGTGLLVAVGLVSLALHRRR